MFWQTFRDVSFLTSLKMWSSAIIERLRFFWGFFFLDMILVKSGTRKQ